MRILRLKKYEAPARIVVLCLLFLTVTHSALAQSTADIGKVLGTDGKMYKTVAAATNAGTTASGIIAYWGGGWLGRIGQQFLQRYGYRFRRRGIKMG